MAGRRQFGLYIGLLAAVFCFFLARVADSRDRDQPAKPEQSIRWMATEQAAENVAKVGVELTRDGAESHIGAIAQLPDGTLLRGRAYQQRRLVSGFAPPAPAPIGAALLADLSRAFVVAEYQSINGPTYEVWILDLVKQEQLDEFRWSPKRDCLISVSPIPNTDLLLEQSLCIGWGSRNFPCENPPLLLRVLDRGYSSVWERRFSLDKLPNQPPPDTEPYLFVLSGRAGIVTIEDSAFRVLSDSNVSESAFRVQKHDDSVRITLVSGARTNR